MAFNVSDSDGDRKHYDPEIQENLNHDIKGHLFLKTGRIVI